jgi:shikimate dehydrogenase
MNSIDRYAVIGSGIGHSRSPQIHALFAKATRQAMEYGLLDVPPVAFQTVVRNFFRDGGRGLNVTVPHKEAALRLADTHTPRAQRAGAVNTLASAANGKLLGDNTDGAGLVRDLTVNLGCKLAGARVLLLGAGGAARGALAPLLDEKPSALVISSRTPWRVEKLAAEFKAHGPLRASTHLALKGDQFDLVINATSAGQHGEVPRLAEGLLAARATCYDLSYGTAFEPFRSWAIKAGAERIADGLGMLVEQAASSFEAWRGVRPATRPVIARLRDAG